MCQNLNFYVYNNFSYLKYPGCENAEISTLKYFPPQGYFVSPVAPFSCDVDKEVIRRSAK